MIFFGFYFLRLAGQGSLWLVCMNAINQWFIEKRAQVMSVVSFIVGFMLTGVFSTFMNKAQERGMSYKEVYKILFLIELCVVLPAGVFLL